MFFSDHNPPHFHAVYGDYVGLFNLETLELIEGDLPNRAVSLIQEWGKLYQEDLIRIWNSQEFVKLPGLK